MFRSFSIIFFGFWVKIRLHTENQLPRLTGSALKVPGWVGGGGWWVPTHYQVKLQLMLRLSWAVTTTHVEVELGFDKKRNLNEMVSESNSFSFADHNAKYNNAMISRIFLPQIWWYL